MQHSFDQSYLSMKFKIIYQFYKTALHIAVEIDNFEIVELLTKTKNINILIKDSQEKKAIDYSKGDEIRQLLS